MFNLKHKGPTLCSTVPTVCADIKSEIHAKAQEKSSHIRSNNGYYTAYNCTVRAKVVVYNSKIESFNVLVTKNHLLNLLTNPLNANNSIACVKKSRSMCHNDTRNREISNNFDDSAFGFDVQISRPLIKEQNSRILIERARE